MDTNLKSTAGYIIPAISIIGFFIALFSGQSIFSIIIAVAGLFVWFIYLLVVEAPLPSNIGNLVILFGTLLSLGIFIGYGIEQNMWGGFQFKLEGMILSMIILFFSVLTGMLFRNQLSTSLPSSNSNLSEDDKKWVESALSNIDIKSDEKEPKIIIVKQESKEKENTKDSDDPKLTENQDLLNPGLYSYPPEYYYDEEDYEEDYQEDYEEDDEDDEDD